MILYVFMTDAGVYFEYNLKNNKITLIDVIVEFSWDIKRKCLAMIKLLSHARYKLEEGVKNKLY